jgi:hypothetical protein
MPADAIGQIKPIGKLGAAESSDAFDRVLKEMARPNHR